MAKPATHISQEEVKKIASLAHIRLDDSEVEKFQKELSSILEYVEKLNEVDTKGVEKGSHVEMTNVFRDDTTEPSLTQEEALANRKNRAKGGYFSIKSVFDHSDDITS